MAKKAAITRNKVAPHPLLLALVAQFLERNGFNSSHRIYNTERRKRPKKEGWQGTFGRDYTAKAPPLEAIFQAWEKDNWTEGADERESENEADTSSSEKNAASEVLSSPEKIKVDDSDNATSKDSSDSESSDEEVAGGKTASETKFEPPNNHLGKGLKRKASSSSSESDPADSDNSTSNSEVTSSNQEPHIKKRRMESSSSSSEASSSGSESDADSDSSSSQDSESESHPTAKASKVAAGPGSAPGNSISTDETSSDSESSSDEEMEAVAHTSAKADSDSSGTVVADVKNGQGPSDSSSSENAARKKNNTIAKKRHAGAQPTKLAQLSAAADPDNYISNTYVSYDYADKAYRDLSVTRGKGFTKEKNKKKRGSYRGGAIDVSGGKAFKFDD